MENNTSLPESEGLSHSQNELVLPDNWRTGHSCDMKLQPGCRTHQDYILMSDSTTLSGQERAPSAISENHPFRDSFRQNMPFRLHEPDIQWQQPGTTTQIPQVSWLAPKSLGVDRYSSIRSRNIRGSRSRMTQSLSSGS